MIFFYVNLFYFKIYYEFMTDFSIVRYTNIIGTPNIEVSKSKINTNNNYY